MLQAIDFVSGSIADSDLIPEQRFISLDKTYIYASNGVTFASAPCDTQGVVANVEGKKFISTVKQTKGDISLKLTKRGLTCSNKRLVCFVPSMQLNYTFPNYAHVAQYEIKHSNKTMLCFEHALRFVGIQSSVPWTDTLLVHNGVVTATNSAAVIQVWLPELRKITKQVVLPGYGIQELIKHRRRKLIQITDTATALIFHFENQFILGIHKCDYVYPDLSHFLENRPYKKCQPVGKLFQTLKQLKPHLDDFGNVWFKKGTAYTDIHQNKGAMVPVEVTARGNYALPNLMLLENVASHIYLNDTGSIATFYSNNSRGIVAGKLNRHV